MRELLEYRQHTRTAKYLGTLLVAVLALSGCTGLAEDSLTESAKQQRDFADVYTQQIDWQTCDEALGYKDDYTGDLLADGARVNGMQCATVAAPLDWNDPTQKDRIKLAVLHIPATGEHPIGTLLNNPGGPGGSGIDLAIGLTKSESFAEVQESFDLLGFDPRGIERSSAVSCDADTEIVELKLALCAKANPLVSSMGTAQVARDMELLRALSEDPMMHYLGYSYGTTIGATYATLFPEHVGRIVLDSANPSDWASPFANYRQQVAIVQAVNDMLASCGKEYKVASCPIKNMTALSELVPQLNDHPLTAADGTFVSGDTLREYFFAALYKLPTGRIEALDVASRALQSDQQAIEQIVSEMSDGGAQVSINGTVVSCLSAPRDAKLAELYLYLQEHGLPVELGGPELNDESLREFFDLSCEALPESGRDFMEFENLSDQTILVFGITGDHATPYQNAQQLVNELGNAQLVTLQGRGHGASFADRSLCADDIVTRYLIDGELPAQGKVCTDDLLK